MVIANILGSIDDKKILSFLLDFCLITNQAQLDGFLCHLEGGGYKHFNTGAGLSTATGTGSNQSNQSIKYELKKWNEFCHCMGIAIAICNTNTNSNSNGNGTSQFPVLVTERNESLLDYVANTHTLMRLMDLVGPDHLTVIRIYLKLYDYGSNICTATLMAPALYGYEGDIGYSCNKHEQPSIFRFDAMLRKDVKLIASVSFLNKVREIRNKLWSEQYESCVDLHSILILCTLDIDANISS